jgi:hypothetical protein
MGETLFPMEAPLNDGAFFRARILARRHLVARIGWADVWG